MKIIRPLRRRCLIIQNPGGISDSLPGVSKDIKTLLAFLKSNCGGAWNDNEITIMPSNATLSMIQDYFTAALGLVDYFLIVFTGHGAYDEEYGPIYYLKNEECFNAFWLKEQVSHIPTMLITDSCQCINTLEKGGILEHRSFSAIADGTLRSEYRRQYNNFLRSLPRDMFVIAASVSPGEEAGEDSNLVGYYLSSLIDVSRKIFNDDESEKEIYGIGYIHHLASEEVERLSKGKQTPYLEGYTRSHQPPFMLKL